jgi:hypothetical protein
MEKQRLITSEKTLSKNDIITSNEKFIQAYCRKKGWSSNDLTTKQLLEITSQIGYIKPKK